MQLCIIKDGQSSASVEAVYTRNIVQPLPGQLQGTNSTHLNCLKRGSINMYQRLASEGWARYLGGCSTNEDHQAAQTELVCEDYFSSFLSCFEIFEPYFLETKDCDLGGLRAAASDDGSFMRSLGELIWG